MGRDARVAGERARFSAAFLSAAVSPGRPFVVSRRYAFAHIYAVNLDQKSQTA
jgi:hypothetical protein